MTDISGCKSRLDVMRSTFSASQPPMYAWADWNQGCSGTEAHFPVGEYDLNKGYPSVDGGTFQPFDLDSMWVPPNLVASVANDHTPGASFFAPPVLGPYVDFPGSDGLDGYLGLYANIDRANKPIKINQVSRIKLKEVRPWKEHIQRCCVGDESNPQACGQYTDMSKQSCQDLFSCSGDNLMVHADNNMQSRGCQSMCKLQPEKCDAIKLDYCDKNPTSPWCKCLTIPKDPKYQEWARAFSKKYPQLIPNLLSYDDGTGVNACRSGTTDNVDIFLTRDIVEARKHLPDKFTIQELNVSGTGNVVNSDMTAGDNQNAPPPPSPAEKAQWIKGIDNNMLIIIAVIIVVLLLVSGDDGDSELKNEYPGYYRYNEYQPVGFNPYFPALQ